MAATSSKVTIEAMRLRIGTGIASRLRSVKTTRLIGLAVFIMEVKVYNKDRNSVNVISNDKW